MLNLSHSNRSGRTRGRMALLGALAAIAGGAGAAPAAQAAPAPTDWTSVSANTASGTVAGTTVSLSGTHVWDVPTSRVDGSWPYFAAPVFSPALPKSDMLQIGGASGASYTIHFGATVTDPTLHVASLGSRITFTKGGPVAKVSGEKEFEVTANSVSGAPDSTIDSSGNTDASGTIKLSGPHTSISFTAVPNYSGPTDGILVQLMAQAATPGTTPPPPCAGADTPITASTLAAAESALVCLTNEERRKAGLKELKLNATLTGTARAHSNDMVQRGYYAHNTPAPEGRTPCQRMTAAGYPWCASQPENIHQWKGYNSTVTPRQFMYTSDGKGWMQSPGHRAAILNPSATEFGVGMVAGNPFGTPPGWVGFTVTQNFGSRAV